MSTTSEIPPSARPSTADPPNGPIPLFDSQLRLLSDSYLGFFLERKRIEEIYIDSLRKLHSKATSIDGYLDDRIEPSTVRNVWTEIRDNVAAELQGREAFVSALTADVINPLSSLKDTQERIRKRIRDDLKDAITAHTEYVENTYPKLKRAYLKKSQDVEDFKAAAVAERSPLSPTHSADNSHVTSPKLGPTRPVVTAPQPLRPLERRASGSIASTRNRSPSSSTTLHDLAHQGKRQLNQLITFLDKNGVAGVKETLAGRSDNTLRAVRAKREADEADKEYRKGVHWLETLRLRRVKLLQSGYHSLESFMREMSTTLKSVLSIYIDTLLATATTQKQMCERIALFIEGINPDRDVKSISQHIPQLLAATSPKPQYYYNYSVGECKDLVFGVSLVDYATSRGLPEGEVPKIIKLCIEEIEKRGMDAEGIYRVSGRHAAVLELQHKLERNEAGFQFQAPHDDVYAVASLLKLYLRELPEPVFKFPLQDRIQHTDDFKEHISNDFQLLRSKIRRLPPVHQATLKAIVEHLARVAARSEKNKMDPKNLAIVFGSVIFGEDDLPKNGDLLSVQAWKDTLMEDLITHAHILFQPSQSPPLPAAPLGEPVPEFTYGSQHTKVTQVPPPLPRRSPSPRKRPESMPPPLPPRVQPQPQPTSSTDDFTPQLPPRPANSIHPSLRSGPFSASVKQSSPVKPFVEETIPFASSSNASSISPTTSTSSQQASVPPSPARSSHRRAPTALPLPSPWSDRDGIASTTSSSPAPTLASAGQSLRSKSESRPTTPAVPEENEDLDFEPVSAPSSDSAYESAKSASPAPLDNRTSPTPSLPPKPSILRSSSSTNATVTMSDATSKAPSTHSRQSSSGSLR